MPTSGRVREADQGRYYAPRSRPGLRFTQAWDSPWLWCPPCSLFAIGGGAWPVLRMLGSVLQDDGEDQSP